MDDLRCEFRRQRESRNITQQAMARELHVTQATLSAFETGKNYGLRRQTMAKLYEIVQQWRAEEKIVGFPHGEGHRAFVEDRQGRRGRSEDRNDDSEPESSDALQLMREALLEYLGGDAISRVTVRRMSPRQVFRFYTLLESQRHV